MFYSRRIGIQADNIIPIIGGARLFGKLNKTNVGVMSLQTYHKDTISTTNYSVVRIKQDIFKQSNIGFISTHKYSETGYNRIYGTDFAYSTSELFNNKNLYIAGQFALSETKIFDESTDLNKDNLSYNFYLSYPNDVVEYDFGFSTIEKGFNPEMGFLFRQNYEMLFTELQFNPRFKKIPFFRNLIFKPIDVNYYINHETKQTESIFYEWRPFGFITKSGEFAEFNIQHIYDYPAESFNLIDTITIQVGEYWDNRFEFQGHTFRGRKISAGFQFNIGDFYTGKRQEYELETNFNINKHLNINFDWERNYVELTHVSFVTNEIGGRINYAFNPKLQTGIFTQWNNESNNVLVNYRLNWIPKIGSFFYFVINQEYDTSNKVKLEKTTIIAKLIWRFAL